MDENLRLTSLSDRYQELTGVDPREIVGKTRVEIAMEAADGEKWWRHLEDLEARRAFRDFRYDVARSDGTAMSVSVSGKPVFDADGRFRGYRGTGTDITEQRRAERARDEALEAAERANRAKSEFLAAMSHELRTPLNAILGFSDILNREYFGPLGSDRYREYADDIHASAAHLLELVNDLLDISAIEAGKTALVIEPIVVADIVADCAHTFAEAVKAKGIDLETRVPEGLPAFRADRRAIKQVLLNLLSNAVKFTRDGGRIVVEAAIAGDEALLAVSDTGTGIPQDRLPGITDPFTRAEGSAYMSEKGWGLGLSISRSLVDLHGGRLEIESRVGKGTRVTVRLPIGPSR